MEWSTDFYELEDKEMYLVTYADGSVDYIEFYDGEWAQPYNNPKKEVIAFCKPIPYNP